MPANSQTVAIAAGTGRGGSGFAAHARRKGRVAIPDCRARKPPFFLQKSQSCASTDAGFGGFGRRTGGERRIHAEITHPG